jgi:lauroyl/myristoyl acyltransferase
VARTEANTTGGENIDAALALGKGAIIALPHQGNWDVAGAWLIAHSGPFATVAERLKPESLFDRFVEYRESLGMEVIPLTGGERSPISVLTERLKENKVVCLLADRDLSSNGIEVQFFGGATRMPGGPALLAATTGASLLPVSLWFTDDGGWGQCIYPPVPVPEGRLRDRVHQITQAMADVFAEGIAAHPTDWHMLQRLWLSDLPPRPAKDGED